MHLLYVVVRLRFSQSSLVALQSAIQPDYLVKQDNSTNYQVWYRDVKHNVVGSGRKGKFKQSKLVQIGIYIW